MSATLTRQQRYALTHRLREMARTQFVAFLSVMYPQSANAFYKLTRFHLALADIVQGMVDGRLSPNQSVSAPPQHGKSSMLAVRAVAWLLGRKSGIKIALTGFSRSLLVDFLDTNGGVKGIIESPSYQAIFPGVRIIVSRADFVMLSNGSSVIVRSTGSKLTGRGADWLIVDDAHAGRAEAESDTLRNKVITWFKGDCLTRISPTAKILVIGTRFHKQDLIGAVMSEDFSRAMIDAGHGDKTFVHTNFKALSDGPESDPLGRPDGEPLAPETRPMSFLTQQRAMLLGYEWDAQFQGDPGAYRVGQIDLTKLVYCSAGDVPKDIDRTRGWDTALSEAQTADFTAGAKCSRYNDFFYIEDMAHFRAAWPVARKRIAELSLEERARNEVYRIGVEGVAGFGVVVQTLRELLLGQVSVTARNPPKGGKLLRAQPWLTMIEAGKVVIVRGAWNSGFLSELEQFPGGPHDDQCFAGKTMIETEAGPRRIDSIVEGDMVWTRCGLRQVTRVWRNGRKLTHTYRLHNGVTIEATPNHPVITASGKIVSIDAVAMRYDHTTWSTSYNSTALITDVIQTATESTLGVTTSVERRTGNEGSLAFTGIHGLLIEDLYLQDTISITKTETRSTTRLTIWSALATETTVESTGCRTNESRFNASIYGVSENPRRNGMDRMPAENGTQIMEKGQWRVDALSNACASLAVYRLCLSNQGPQHAVTDARLNGLTCGQSYATLVYASSVEALSGHRQIRLSYAACHVERLTQTGSEQEVYNLEVDGVHEYFVEGLLVHNCDAVSIAYEQLFCPERLLIA